MYYVYMLECADGNIYTGITNNLEKRFAAHKNKKGGAYTASHPVKRILYTERKRIKGAALKREAEIKRWPRKKKLGLVKLGSR
jgi:putative endonuclease